jgi:hypothetical protein
LPLNFCNKNSDGGKYGVNFLMQQMKNCTHSEIVLLYNSILLTLQENFEQLENNWQSKLAPPGTSRRRHSLSAKSDHFSHCQSKERTKKRNSRAERRVATTWQLANRPERD